MASAGNSSDIPFITGTPGSADTVIGVAASQPALLTGPALTVGAPLNASYPLITGAFGIPLVNALTRPLAFAGPNNTVASNLNTACSVVDTGGANPGPAVPAIPALAGAIGISDRGVCGFNEKALNTQRAGGSVAIIANNVVGQGPIGMAANPAAPLTTIPSYSIGTGEGAAVKAALAVNPGLQATVSPLGDAANAASGVDLVDLISDFSSRGPAQNLNAIKPEITAPGSNIFMANIGTGTGGGNSSGTSFAAPLTTGAAALVLAARPAFTPWQVKAALMNTANPNVFATKTAAGTTLAGITRMGAGRLQADRAVATDTLAYDSEDIDPTGTSYYNASLSFGPQAFTAAGASSVARTLVLQNLGTSARQYRLGVAPRFANDLARGVALSVSPSTLTVAPGATGTVQVVATATGSQLPVDAGGFPLRLLQTDLCTTTTAPPAPVAACTGKFNDLEQDGFVTIKTGGDDQIRVPYLLYPRQASNVLISRLGSQVVARNTGVANTVVDVFNLVGAPDPQDQTAPIAGSENYPVDIRAVGVRFTPNAVAPPANVPNGDVLEFAISLWRPVDTLRPVGLDVELDVNDDGVTDFTVRNLNSTSNRHSVFISTGTTGTPGNAFFFAGAALNTTKIVLPVFASLVNVNANSRIGIRVVESAEQVPDAGTFQYLRLGQLIHTPSVRSFVAASGASQTFAVASNGDNKLQSPGDKGLLLFLGDNPVASETATLQLVR